MLGMRRMFAGALTAALLSAVGLLAATGTAHADGERLGQRTAAQPYKNKPNDYDWLGSYTWRGEQVWCVQFALREPSDAMDFQPGGPLTTKWGEQVPPSIAAQISYLLLRYEDTTSAEEAAALAHLLQAWTSGTDDPARLDPNNTFDTIGYNVPFHLDALTAGAREAVQRLRADAQAHHGPWTVEVIEPDKATPATIGEPGQWKVVVRSANGSRPVGNVPVRLVIEQARLSGQGATQELTLRTPADGSPLVVELTPTGSKPSLSAAVDSPAEQPVLLVPTDPNMQRILTTGGRKIVQAKQVVQAQPGRGGVRVAKVNTADGKPIPGVSLRLTAGDRTSPALAQDGTKLVGPDGAPVVLVTGQDGTVVVERLQAPQDICLIEVAPVPGYEEGFDPNAPPTVCGTIDFATTLALSLANKPNVPKPTVPITIPAGEQDQSGMAIAGRAPVRTVLNTGALVGFGVLVLLASGVGGLLWRRWSSSMNG